MASLIGGAAAVLVLIVLMWAPLVPALIWGKAVIPGPQVGGLLRASARKTIMFGAPLMFTSLTLICFVNPERPPLMPRLAVCLGLTLLSLPMYGALITTRVFREWHSSPAAAGAALRPLLIRFAAGAVILFVNFWALLFTVFFVAAMGGAYRGWS